jgi:hypothetical protein
MKPGDLVTYKSSNSLGIILEYRDEYFKSGHMCYVKIKLIDNNKELYVSPTSLRVIS